MITERFETNTLELIELLSQYPNISVQRDRIGETSITVGNEPPHDSYSITIFNTATGLEKEGDLVLLINQETSGGDATNFSLVFSTATNLEVRGRNTGEVNIKEILANTLIGIQIIQSYIDLETEQKLIYMGPYNNRVYDFVQQEDPTLVSQAVSPKVLDIAKERIEAYLENQEEM